LTAAAPPSWKDNTNFQQLSFVYWNKKYWALAKHYYIALVQCSSALRLLWKLQCIALEILRNPFSEKSIYTSQMGTRRQIRRPLIRNSVWSSCQHGNLLGRALRENLHHFIENRDDNVVLLCSGRREKNIVFTSGDGKNHECSGEGHEWFLESP
jgi:hypothetical protein